MRVAKLIAAAAVLLAACDGSTSSKPVPKIETTQFDPALGVDLASSVKLASGMYYRDTTAGTGTVVTPHSVVQVYYVGAFPNGTVFDSRRTGDSPFVFEIAANPSEVIEGWNQGIMGMAEGGQRQLIIPPDLGYGANDFAGVIP